MWDIEHSNLIIYNGIADEISEDDAEIITIDNIGRDSIINNNVVEEILYSNYEENNDLIKLLNNILKDNNEMFIIVENNYMEHLNFDMLYKKYGELANDLYPLLNNSILVNTNRFFNNKIMTNVLSKDVCYWIINECEKVNNWKDSNYVNYNNYLNIDKLPAVSKFVNFSANFYLMQLKKIYNITENVNLIISDIFMTKYTKKNNCVYKKTPDRATFVMNIQINDTLDFEGGEIDFSNNDDSISKEDNKILLKQGDMILYNKFQRRSNGDVTSGEKYMLVFFINIAE